MSQTTNKQISHYRNEQTGELSPPHWIGYDDAGLAIYQWAEGWTPVDADGNEVECDRDADGNYLVAE